MIIRQNAGMEQASKRESIDWPMASLVGMLHIAALLMLFQQHHGVSYGVRQRNVSTLWLSNIPESSILKAPGHWVPTAEFPANDRLPGNRLPETPEPGVRHDEAAADPKPTPASSDVVDDDPNGGAAIGANVDPGGARLNQSTFADLRKMVSLIMAGALNPTILCPPRVSVHLDLGGMIDQVRLESTSGDEKVDALVAEIFQNGYHIADPDAGADRVSPKWYSLPPLSTMRECSEA